MAFFPECQEDELLYSVLARYHLMSGNTSFKHTLSDIFGSETVCAIVDLPSHLDSLSKHIPGDAYRADLLIDKHTLYPYFEPFLSTERANAVRKSMVGDAASSVHNLIGTRNCQVKNPKYLRFCPVCASEQELEVGFSFWMRLYQLPGVFICPKHQVKLQDSSVIFSRWNNQRKFEVLDLVQSPRVQSIEEQELNILLFIATQSQRLLEYSPRRNTPESTRKFYFSKLRERGYVTNYERVRFQELIPEFVQFYGAKFLGRMQSGLDVGNNDTWLEKVLHTANSFCHPLRHILILRFLGETVESLFESQHDVFQPFGKAPWPCLNKAAVHYRQDVIPEYQISTSKKDRGLIGVFKCECGYIYTRSGKTATEDCRYRGRVKKHGSVWEQRLHELIEENASLRSVAHRLGTTIGTVNRHLDMHDDTTSRQTQKLDRTRKLEEYRRNWLAHLEKNSMTSRTHLRKTLPNVYAWLYRNDRQWIVRTLPPKQNSHPKSTQIDWAERDEWLSDLIVSEVHNLKNQPVWITKHHIGREIGKLYLFQKYLNKLPKCDAVLKEVVESIDDFRARLKRLAIS